jgi:hypothetical protein
VPATSREPIALAVCAIFKNEGKHIEEWLDFHLAQGVEHFYLYDNGSTDDGLQRLAPYITRGLVTLIDWPIAWADGAQLRAYDHCVVQVKDRVHWLAFIDIDEFLFARSGDLLPTLNRYDQYPGVVVHWACYGSLSHYEEQGAGLLNTYLYRAPTRWRENRKYKSIVHPSRVQRILGAHGAEYLNGDLAVNEQMRTVPPQPTPELKKLSERLKQRDVAVGKRRSIVSQLARRIRKIAGRMKKKLQRVLKQFQKRYLPLFPRHSVWPQGSSSLLTINHYRIRSRREYDEKIARWNAKQKYKPLHFSYYDRNEVFDPILKGRGRGPSVLS